MAGSGKSVGPTRTMVAIALVCLCVQNSALVLSMKYTRSVLKETYLTSTAVVLMECVKFALSWLMMYRDGARTRDVIVALRRSMPMCVPSLLYVMQNSLQFVAVNHLDASTFTILSQLKILTTAVCSVLMLGTRLSLRKWRALMLLVIGAVLVQFPTPASSSANASNASRTSFTGLAAILGMVCLSGVAGIWLEKFLKNKDTAPLPSAIHSTPAATLWERNLQLSLYGILFGLSSVAINDYQAVREQGFFHSYSLWTMFVILTAAVGGLIVAVVVKYTNTIVKGFATSISIMLTAVCSLALFPSDELGWLFWLGASCVLLSIFNYNEEDGAGSGSSGGSSGGGVNGVKGDGEATGNGVDYKKVMEQPLMGGDDADENEELNDTVQLLRK